MKVLLIDNHDSFVYNLAQQVEETGLCSLDVISYDDVDEKKIEGYDKFIISPGPGIPDDFPKLQDFILRFYTSKISWECVWVLKPLRWLLAERFILPAKYSMGIQRLTKITDSGNSIFKGIPEQFEAGCYHSWILNKDTFPEGIKITAMAEDGIIMALSHRKYNLAGFQYHPESIMTKYGKQMILNWLTQGNDR
ncbi:MAG: aminodeoxychorismate/anthranilate synthase component II [Bacteroidales bacterium]